MKLSDFKKHLKGKEKIAFQLPNGNFVPNHFHITEVGEISKKLIDCGGTLREEKVINFQLWEENDYDHRLHPEKLIHIIELSEEKLNLEDNEIEVEYQGETISKYGLDIANEVFLLTSKQTDCLAKDACGIPEKKKIKLSKTPLNSSNSCTPENGCCIKI